MESLKVSFTDKVVKAKFFIHEKCDQHKISAHFLMKCLL